MSSKKKTVFFEDWFIRLDDYTIQEKERRQYRFVVLAISIVFIITLAILIALCFLTVPKQVESKSFDTTITIHLTTLEDTINIMADPTAIPTAIPTITPTLKSLSLPKVSGEKKTHMDYRSITREGSAQLLLQAHSYTNHQGLRMSEGYFLVALGTYYAKQIGDKFTITFGNGVSIKAMAGDVKADKDTDSTNRYDLGDGSVVEFIIDKEVLDKAIYKGGDISKLGFEGKIISITREE